MENRVLHIGKIERQFIADDTVIVILQTLRNKLKYSFRKYRHKDTYVVFFQLSKDTDEVIIIGDLKSFVQRDVVSGNHCANSVYVSDNDYDYLKEQKRAILKFSDEKYYFYLKYQSYEYNNISYYIRQSSLSEKEIKITNLYYDNSAESNKITYDDILKQYAIVSEKIDSLNINEIIDSYRITVETNYISKPCGDDRCYVDQKTNYLYKDDYLLMLLPNYSEELYSDSGYTTDLYPNRKFEIEWEKEADKLTEFHKTNAKKMYNKNTHKLILTSQYIMNNEHLYYREKYSHSNLQEHTELLWNDVFCHSWNKNNYKENIQRYNTNEKDLTL